MVDLGGNIYVYIILSMLILALGKITFFASASQFPSATGMYFVAERERVHTAIYERNGRFLEPPYGWMFLGRTYFVVEKSHGGE